MGPQGGQPGQPNAPQNPFLQMLAHLQSQGGQQSPGQNQPMLQAMMQKSSNPPGAMPGGAPVGGPSAQGIPGAQQPDIQDAALPGQNPGSSKQLIAAMNLLHQAITSLDDPQEIQMLRSIIVLLTRLINADQEKQNQNTGRFASNPSSDGLQQGSPSPAA